MWQFRAGSQPVNVATENAAVSTWFHGDPETGVEDAFMAVEGEQGALLQALDGGAPLQEHVPALQEFVWLMGCRTRSLRQRFVEAAEVALSVFEEADDATLLGALERKWQQEADQLIDERLSQVDPRLVAELTARLPQFREHLTALCFALLPSALGGVEKLIAQARRAFPGAAKDGHVRALGLLLAARVPGPMREFTEWTIEHDPSNSLVLGDGVAICQCASGEVGGVSFVGRDGAAVYTPISSSQLLVGRKVTQHPPKLSMDEVNTHSAKTALDTLFATEDSVYNRELLSHVGSEASLVPKDELRDLALLAMQPPSES